MDTALVILELVSDDWAWLTPLIGPLDAEFETAVTEQPAEQLETLAFDREDAQHAGVVRLALSGSHDSVTLKCLTDSFRVFR
ncbi:hypothetical protein DFQ28_010034 [Apophysomyces sp. BC1034]|nr:hypothetical protein DFQ28_010034 [Apophysomyces sp. BC1034]